MKRKYSVIMLIASLVIILAMVAGCSSGPATPAASNPSPAATTASTAGKTITLGAIIPVTGVAAEKGKPGLDGLMDSIQYVNQEMNGAGGYQIKLDWKDSSYNAATVNTITTDLVNEGVPLFTAMSSFEMTNAMGIANKAGMPGLAVYTSPNLYNPPQHIYGEMPDYGDDWVAFTNYYLKNIWKGPGQPKMALELLNNSTGSSVQDVATAKASAMGVDIVDIEQHAATTISEMDALTRIKAKNPDVIFISSTPQPTSVILKNLKDLGLTPANVTIGMAHASFDKSLVDLAGADVANGVYGVFPTVTWADNAPGIAKATEYLQKDHPGDAGKLDYLSMWCTGLVSTEILKNAVQGAGYDVLAKGGPDAWKAVEQYGIHKLNYDVQGLQGAVSYTPGDNRLDKNVKVYTIKGGQIAPVSGWISEN